MKFSKKIKRILNPIVFALAILVIPAVAGLSLNSSSKKEGAASDIVSGSAIAHESDFEVDFLMEIYDSIVKNYWQKVDTKLLAEHFKSSVKTSPNLPQGYEPVLASSDREGVKKMLEGVFAAANQKTAVKKDLALSIANIAVYNLSPIGRNELRSAKQEIAFRENVSNIDRNKDLYGELNIEKGSDIKKVEKAYEEVYVEKVKTLEKATTTEAKAEAKKEIEKAAYAKEVLTNNDNKKLYDEHKIEPTIVSQRFGTTLYIHIKKISPTTVVEFVNAVNAASTTAGINSMILDLRGNIGGSMDFATIFLGLFMGYKRYAFDFFQQGDLNAQRTSVDRFPALDRYKEVMVFTDTMTQSTSEVIAAAFKRFKLGTVMGEKTRGWGSVENTFPLTAAIDPNEKYALFLVHSLTVRDDNQFIEGFGVVPDIDIKKTNWKNELRSRIHSADLIKNAENLIAKPPLK